MAGNQPPQVSYMFQNFITAWDHTGRMLVHDLQHFFTQPGMTGPTVGPVTSGQTVNPLPVPSFATGPITAPTPSRTAPAVATSTSARLSSQPASVAPGTSSGAATAANSEVAGFQFQMKGEHRYWYNDSGKPPGTNDACTRPACQRKKAERLGCSMLKYGTHGPQCRNIVHSHIGCSGYQAKDFINTGNKWGCHMINYDHDFPNEDDDGDDEGELGNKEGALGENLANHDTDNGNIETPKTSRMQTRGQAKSKTGSGRATGSRSGSHAIVGRLVSQPDRIQKPTTKRPQTEFCGSSACMTPDIPLADPNDPDTDINLRGVRCMVRDLRLHRCRNQAHGNLDCASVGKTWQETTIAKHKGWACTRTFPGHDFRSDEEVIAGMPKQYDTRTAEISVPEGRLHTISEEDEADVEEARHILGAAAASSSMPPPTKSHNKKIGKASAPIPSASTRSKPVEAAAPSVTKKRQASEPATEEPLAKKQELDPNAKRHQLSSGNPVGNGGQEALDQSSIASSLTPEEDLEDEPEVTTEGAAADKLQQAK